METGICLPDASVYLELCDILGITVSEFLRGEDIPQEKMVEQFNAAFVEVSKDHQIRMKKMKRMLWMTIICSIVIVSILGAVIARGEKRQSNYLIAMDPESTEVKTAEMISASSSAYMFQYSLDSDCITSYFSVSKYHYDEKVEEKIVFAQVKTEGQPSQTEGLITLLLDYANHKIQIVVTGISFQAFLSL